MRPAYVLAGFVLVALDGRMWQEPQAGARTTIPMTGRVLQVPTEPGEPPCFVSIDAWLPETWSEPAYELKETSPGSFYEVPAGTQVKNGETDQSNTAKRDIDRVLYALQTTLAFSDDMLKKTRGACRQLGTWISVRLVRDDPDVLGGMYRTDTNTVFLDMGDLDSERYVAPNASAADANLANRLAKSQNIRTTLAHEFHHIWFPLDGDPVPNEQHLFVGGPGLDENRVMSDLGLPLRRTAYHSPDGTPYEAAGTPVFLRSAPAVVTATGDHESHRLGSDSERALEKLGRQSSRTGWWRC